MIRDHDTIAAPATAAGGALAVIRISGEEALRICDRIFRGRKPLAAAAGYTVHYGEIVDDGRVLDDVLVTVFRAPRSYTGEDAAEISCHGSQYIVSEILRLLTASGARMAGPGEFTIRAYLAGKLDLSQAEAVADIIASSSRAAHALAANQMRGGYSDALEGLCEKLLELTALLELELDFSEEEVEFADRAQLREAMQRIGAHIDALRNSFTLGNAIKEGVAVAITGAPNVGKSTLLKTLYAEVQLLSGEGRVAGYDLRRLRRRDIPYLRRRIGIVFQDYQLLTDRNVFMNLYYVMKATGWKREDQIRERIDQVLKLVDLEAKSYKMPFELSGGEQQRLVIARALLNDPQVLLADEPTGNLDPVTAEGIMRLFQEIAGRGCAVVMSTHNTALIENYPARAILFAQGKIREVDLKAELG